MIDQLIGNIQGMWVRLQLTWRLLNDDRVPVWTKIIPVIAFLYIISPLDILPDVLLGMGQIDDFVVLISGLELFERMIPVHIVEEHRQRLLVEHTEQEEQI
jgi:uncharacterized membrane protein YkvA (DUF1232 family)